MITPSLIYVPTSLNQYHLEPVRPIGLLPISWQSYFVIGMMRISSEERNQKDAFDATKKGECYSTLLSFVTCHLRQLLPDRTNHATLLNHTERLSFDAWLRRYHLGSDEQVSTTTALKSLGLDQKHIVELYSKIVEKSRTSCNIEYFHNGLGEEVENIIGRECKDSKDFEDKLVDLYSILVILDYTDHCQPQHNAFAPMVHFNNVKNPKLSTDEYVISNLEVAVDINFNNVNEKDRPKGEPKYLDIERQKVTGHGGLGLVHYLAAMSGYGPRVLDYSHSMNLDIAGDTTLREDNHYMLPIKTITGDVKHSTVNQRFLTQTPDSAGAIRDTGISYDDMILKSSCVLESVQRYGDKSYRNMMTSTILKYDAYSCHYRLCSSKQITPEADYLKFKEHYDFTNITNAEAKAFSDAINYDFDIRAIATGYGGTDNRIMNNNKPRKYINNLIAMETPVHCLEYNTAESGHNKAERNKGVMNLITGTFQSNFAHYNHWTIENDVIKGYDQYAEGRFSYFVLGMGGLNETLPDVWPKIEAPVLIPQDEVYKGFFGDTGLDSGISDWWAQDDPLKKALGYEQQVQLTPTKRMNDGVHKGTIALGGRFKDQQLNFYRKRPLSPITNTKQRDFDKMGELNGPAYLGLYDDKKLVQHKWKQRKEKDHTWKGDHWLNDFGNVLNLYTYCRNTIRNSCEKYLPSKNNLALQRFLALGYLILADTHAFGHGSSYNNDLFGVKGTPGGPRSTSKEHYSWDSNGEVWGIILQKLAAYLEDGHGTLNTWEEQCDHLKFAFERMRGSYVDDGVLGFIEKRYSNHKNYVEGYIDWGISFLAIVYGLAWGLRYVRKDDCEKIWTSYSTLIKQVSKTIETDVRDVKKMHIISVKILDKLKTLGNE